MSEFSSQPTGPGFADLDAMRLHTLGVTVAMMLTFAPRPALAQSDFVKDNVTKLIKKIGFHASTSFADPMDTKRAYRDGSWGVSVGLAPGKTNGWRYPFGIAWFTEELRTPDGPSFSELKSRPIIAGIGYGWHFGKLSTAASLQGGWAFNSGKPIDPSVNVHIGNAFVVRPQAKVEYFLTRQLTVRSSLNYIFQHPMVTIVSPTGTTKQRWDTSNVTLSLGVGVYPFRK
jgi:hypothetical protein